MIPRLLSCPICGLLAPVRIFTTTLHDGAVQADRLIVRCDVHDLIVYTHSDKGD